MGMDAQKWLQLSALLAQHSQMFTAANPGQNAFAHQLLGSAQSGIMAEALKKQRKEEEKKKKGGVLGSIGSVLGTAAGIAIPGVGPAVGGALGGTLGGVAGQALGGGGFDPMSAAGYGASGLAAGATYGKAGPMTESVENAAAPVAPAPTPPADVVANDVKNSISKASGSAMPASQMKLSDPLQGFTPPSTPKPPKFGRRFGSALSHVMEGPGYRISAQPDGVPDIYYSR